MGAFLSLCVHYTSLTHSEVDFSNVPLGEQFLFLTPRNAHPVLQLY